MGTINYQFEPQQTVWTITTEGTCPSAVVSGVVVQVKPSVLTTGTKILYDVRLDNEKGTTEINETDLFGSLSDAITEYQNRLS